VAAFGGINIPISGSHVVAWPETKLSGSVIDRLRRTLELKEGTYGRFIELQMETRKFKRGAKLFVDEAGAKTK